MAEDNLRVVLVEPSLAANVGAAARAMKTMGLTRLDLVAPRQFPHPDAEAMASGADDVVAGAYVHATLADALNGVRRVVALSARPRSLSVPVTTPREVAPVLRREAEHHPVAVVFGRERTGLTNNELDLCQWLVRIPASPDYSSLNLAASVQVVAYELYQAGGAMESAADAARQPAPSDEMERLYAHLERVLLRIAFLAPDNATLMRRLRLLLGRAEPDDNEVQILRGILAQVEKSLPQQGS